MIKCKTLRRRGLSLLFCAILIFGMLPLTASADDGFLGLVSVLMEEDQLGDPSMIAPMSDVSEGFDLNVCTAWLYMDPENCMLVLSGEDASGELMGVFWTGLDWSTIYSLSYIMVANYEFLSSHCEHGLYVSFHLADGATLSITSAEEAAQKAGLVTAYMLSDVYYFPGEKQLQEAVPYLRTDSSGRSGIFWCCSWKDRPDEVVWIDDQNGSLMGFCLRSSGISSEPPVLYSNLVVLCHVFYAFDVSAVYVLDEGGSGVLVQNINDKRQYYLPIEQTGEYLFFNLFFDPFFTG